MARIWIVLGSIAAVLSLTWAGFGMLTLIAHEQVTEVQTFAADDVDALDLDNDNGSIEIRGQSGLADIRLEAIIDHGLRRTRVSTDIIDRTLVVDTDCPAGPPLRCRVEYRISIPSDLAIDIRNHNGRVLLRDLDGPVRARSSNGPLDAARLSGPIELATSNGPVVARGLTADDAEFRTSNGPVELSFAAAPTTVTARTSNGSLDIVVPDDGTAYRLDVRTSFTGSTDTAIRTDPASPRAIAARTSNGSITVRYPTG